jgi:PKD repeat protein
MVRRARILVALVCCLAFAACSDDGGGSELGDAGSLDSAGDAAGASDTGEGDADEGPDTALPPVTLQAAMMAPRYAEVGSAAAFDGSASVDAISWQWNFGDGVETAKLDTPSTTHVYTEPGRYTAQLTVRDKEGRKRTDSAVVSVTRPVIFAPRQSSTVVTVPLGEDENGSDAWKARIIALSTDGDAITFIEPAEGATAQAPGWTVRERWPGCDGPRTLAVLPGVDPGVGGFFPGGGWYAVACQDEDRVLVARHDGGRALHIIDLPRGSRPFGVLFVTKDELPAPPTEGLMLPDAAEVAGLYVTLQGTGALVQIRIPGVLDSGANDGLGEAGVVRTWPVFADPRHLALLPGGRLAVGRWRSADDAGDGELVVIDPWATLLAEHGFDGVGGSATFGAGPTQRPVAITYDPQPSSDAESGGLPSYLGAFAVTPQADALKVPGMTANMHDGTARNGTPLQHDTTLRAIVASVDLGPNGAALGADASGLAADVTPVEVFDDRLIFDDRGLASAVAISSRGDYMFVAMRGHRSVERRDLLRGVLAGTILDVGYAPEGLALSPDDRFLFVDAANSRQLTVYDVTTFSPIPEPIATFPLVDTEPFAPAVLRGKQLFGDSFDPRLAGDGYIACAHCHMEAAPDLRTWDFTQRGEGLRNTPDLRGRAGMGHGPVHWSANFDEIQDFEGDIRKHFGGEGLLTDAQWDQTSHPLDDAPKAGLSEDLDALAAYLTSLGAETLPKSPWTPVDALGLPVSNAQLADGKALFESPDLGCTTCHSGAAMTDSGFGQDGAPILHDVGTLTPASGQRLGEGPLPGVDTPTLRGLFDTAPYLHDGSAATLHDVLTTKNASDQHGKTSQLSATQLDALVAYLRSLE